MLNKTYDNLTDQELISLIRNNDEQATEILLKNIKIWLPAKQGVCFYKVVIRKI